MPFLRLCSIEHKRHNGLFANTAKEAQASAIIYRIVETTTENGLNPRAYLQYLFEKLLQRDLKDPTTRGRFASVDLGLARPHGRSTTRAACAGRPNPVRGVERTLLLGASQKPYSPGAAWDIDHPTRSKEWNRSPRLPLLPRASVYGLDTSPTRRRPCYTPEGRGSTPNCFRTESRVSTVTFVENLIAV